MPLKIFLAKLSRSVSRILSSLYKAKGNHSSRLLVTEQLKRPTRKRRPNRFGQISGQLKKNVSLFGLAPRGVYPAAPVTKRADALLPRRFTHHLLAGLFSVALVVIRF